MGLLRRKRWPHVEHSEIVRRARILVVDDRDFPYLQLFTRDGYTMEKWDSVQELARLEDQGYDLILLDLLGVGTHESADEGLGILEHIRKVSPAQLVIAYSNADWSLEYQPFFDKADAVLHKTKADYVEFKRTVDRLLDQRFSLGFYLSRISDELGDVPGAEKARRRAERAILAGRPEALRGYLAGRVDDAVTVDRVLAVAEVAVGVAQLWKS